MPLLACLEAIDRAQWKCKRRSDMRYNTQQGCHMQRLLTTKQAAELLGLKPSTLRAWRCSRIGPPYIQLGPRNIKYPEGELEKYVDERRFDHSVTQKKGTW